MREGRDVYSISRNDFAFNCAPSDLLLTPKAHFISRKEMTGNNSNTFNPNDIQHPPPHPLNENRKSTSPTSASLMSICHDKKVKSYLQSQYVTLDSRTNSQSCLSCDRFIPNRSHLRSDLCRATILYADKRRCDVMEKKIFKKSEKIMAVVESKKHIFLIIYLLSVV